MVVCLYALMMSKHSGDVFLVSNFPVRGDEDVLATMRNLRQIALASQVHSTQVGCCTEACRGSSLVWWKAPSLVGPVARMLHHSYRDNHPWQMRFPASGQRVDKCLLRSRQPVGRRIAGQAVLLRIRADGSCTRESRELRHDRMILVQVRMMNRGLSGSRGLQTRCGGVPG